MMHSRSSSSSSVRRSITLHIIKKHIFLLLFGFFVLLLVMLGLCVRTTPLRARASLGSTRRRSWAHSDAPFFYVQSPFRCPFFHLFKRRFVFLYFFFSLNNNNKRVYTRTAPPPPPPPLPQHFFKEKYQTGRSKVSSSSSSSRPVSLLFSSLGATQRGVESIWTL